MHFSFEILYSMLFLFLNSPSYTYSHSAEPQSRELARLALTPRSAGPQKTMDGIERHARTGSQHSTAKHSKYGHKKSLCTTRRRCEEKKRQRQDLARNRQEAILGTHYKCCTVVAAGLLSSRDPQLNPARSSQVPRLALDDLESALADYVVQVSVPVAAVLPGVGGGAAVEKVVEEG